jgi:hypothetical protein
LEIAWKSSIRERNQQREMCPQNPLVNPISYSQILTCPVQAPQGKTPVQAPQGKTQYRPLRARQYRPLKARPKKKDFSEKKIRSRKAVSGKAARQFRRHQSPPRAFSTQDGTASYGRPFSLDALDQRAVKSSAPCLQITAMVS